MGESISKFIDTTADWNTGTLTDVVAVNDGLELLRTRLSFDGIDDYATASVDTTATERTFMATVFLNQDTHSGTRRFISETYPSYVGGYISIESDNKLKCGVADGVSTKTVVQSTEFVLKEKVNIAYTWKNNGKLTLYVEGTNVGEISIGDVQDIQDGFRIGTYRTADARFWEGTIKNISIWDKELSQAEIQKYMGAELSGNETGLKHYYKMNEGTGTTLIDSAGSNDGTITGATWNIPPLTGNRLSPTIDLSPIGSVDSSIISWESLEGLYFDGVDDYVDLFSPLTIFDKSFKIEGTFYFEEEGRDILFGNLQIGSSPYLNFEKGTDNRLRFYWDGFGIYTPINVIEINKWQKIAFERDKSNGKINFYVNDALVYSEDTTVADMTVSTVHRIGRDNRTGVTALNGKISSFNIYENGSQILNYKFDEGTGTTLTDYAGSNDGIINGATWETIETITIETSVDGGSTWQTATNGSSIPNLIDSSPTLDVRQTLSTADITVTPRLLDLYIDVKASQENLQIINIESLSIIDNHIMVEVLNILTDENIAIIDSANLSEVIQIRESNQVSIIDSANLSEVIQIRESNQVPIIDSASFLEVIQIREANQVPNIDSASFLEVIQIREANQVPIIDSASFLEVITIQEYKQIDIIDFMSMINELQILLQVETDIENILSASEIREINFSISTKIIDTVSIYTVLEVTNIGIVNLIESLFIEEILNITNILAVDILDVTSRFLFIKYWDGNQWAEVKDIKVWNGSCLLYTSPSPRDRS